MRSDSRRHGQYTWRDPESGQQLRVDVFGGEEFFQDLLALGFEPGGGNAGGPHGSGSDDDPSLRARRSAGAELADADDEAPIHQLHPGVGATHPRGTSEGCAEVRRKGA